MKILTLEFQICLPGIGKINKCCQYILHKRDYFTFDFIFRIIIIKKGVVLLFSITSLILFIGGQYRFQGD